MGWIMGIAKCSNSTGAVYTCMSFVGVKFVVSFWMSSMSKWFNASWLMIPVLHNLGMDIGLRRVERRGGATWLVVSRGACLFLILFVLAVETNGMDAKGRGGMTCVRLILGSVPGVFDCMRHWCVLIFVWRTCVDVRLFASSMTRLLLTLWISGCAISLSAPSQG